jgi:hypothetical protein
MLGWFSTPKEQDDVIISSGNFDYPDNVWYDEIDALVYLSRYLCIKDAIMHEDEINARMLKTKIEYDDPKFVEYIKNNFSCYEISPIRESLLEQVRTIIGCSNFPLTVSDAITINSEETLIISKLTHSVIPTKQIIKEENALEFISDEYYVFKMENDKLIQIVKNNDVSEEDMKIIHTEYKLSFEALIKHFGIKLSNELEISLWQLSESNKNIMDELFINDYSNFYDYKYDASKSIYNDLQNLYNRIIDLKSCIGNSIIPARELSIDEASALILSKSFVLLSKFSNKIYNPLTLQQEIGSSNVCAEFYKSFNIVKLIRNGSISKWEVNFSETNYVPHTEDDDVSDDDVSYDEFDTPYSYQTDNFANIVKQFIVDEYIGIAFVVIMITTLLVSRQM